MPSVQTRAPTAETAPVVAPAGVRDAEKPQKDCPSCFNRKEQARSNDPYNWLSTACHTLSSLSVSFSRSSSPPSLPSSRARSLSLARSLARSLSLSLSLSFPPSMCVSGNLRMLRVPMSVSQELRWPRPRLPLLLRLWP